MASRYPTAVGRSENMRRIRSENTKPEVIFGARNEQQGRTLVADLDGRDRVNVVSLDMLDDTSIRRG